MTAGRTWPAEWRSYRDPASGLTVRQLTDYLGHSHHPYFTNSGWFDGGRRLIFGSDRDNRTNLFALDLESGRITQLTDLSPQEPPYENSFLATALNPVQPEAYFYHGPRLIALDLNTLQTRCLWEVPEGFRRSMLNCTADGRFVCAGVFQDLSHRFRIDYQRGYVGFAETWEARPESRIYKVATDGSKAEVVWQERYWIGHVNTSPTQPNLITFCHEGPWQKVDNRIWAMDIEEGKPWAVRPRRHPGECVGHEYWLADGVHIGYHGARADGTFFIGFVRYDNTGLTEADLPSETGHTHSHDRSLVVGDGGSHIRIWRRRGDSYLGPRILAEHRSSKHIQKLHPHPRFSPDGRQVLFTSDRSGYGNLYLVEVPDFDSLPPLEE